MVHARETLIAIFIACHVCASCDSPGSRPPSDVDVRGDGELVDREDAVVDGDGSTDGATTPSCTPPEAPPKPDCEPPDSPDGTRTAVASGRWSDPDIWKDCTVPRKENDVAIQSGKTVTLADETTAPVRRMRVQGTFRVHSCAATKLRAETIEVSKGGRFEMGSDANPVDSSVTAELEFVDHGPLSADRFSDRLGKGLVVDGELAIHGAPKTAWTSLAAHAKKGDTSIELSKPPDNWSAGDTIVVPGLEAYDSAKLEDEDEERTIAAVQGSTVQFEQPLQYDHKPPKPDLESYVLNVTRNVVLSSEHTETSRRGHVMVRSPGSTLKYVETRDLGRTDKSRDVTSPLWGRGDAKPDSPPNPRARYSIHFHKTGPAREAHTVEGVVVRRDPGWGIVNHGSNARVVDSITYRVLGAGFVAEKGNEVGIFKHNFALRSRGSGEETESRSGWSNSFANKMKDPPHNIDDLGHSGHGFWLQSPLVKVEDNVAAGHRHTPYTFWTRALHEQELPRDPSGELEAFLDGKHDMFPKVRTDLLEGLEKKWARTGDEKPPVGKNGPTRFHNKGEKWTYGSSLPLRSFQNNVAFGCGGGFDLRGGLGFRNNQPRLYWATHANNTIYNIGPLWLSDGSKHLRDNFKSSGNVGLDHRYVGNLVADGYRLLGTGDGVGVFRNHAYLDDWHIRNSVIENWKVGVIPPDYGGTPNACEIRNTTFRDNQIDIKINGQMGAKNGGPLILEGNTYSGNTTLHYSEIGIPNMIPERFVAEPGEAHASVRLEGRTLYHGWSDPEFVIVQKGDRQRLNKMLNHGNEKKWKKLLGGDDPSKVLPGMTHRELYQKYGLVYYGGMRDREAADSTERSDLTGSGGAYDTEPFLGPKSKSMPTDEIWIDAANEMSFSGDHQVVEYGDGVQKEQALKFANDQKAVQLNRTCNRCWDLPVKSKTGVASYTFEVQPAGRYLVYARAQRSGLDPTPGGADENSRFYVRVDGGPWKLYAPNRYRWGFHEVRWPGNRDSSDFVAFDLSAGSHTIEFAGKGAGMRLDWVLIKHETCAAIPYGDGKPHTSK